MRRGRFVAAAIPNIPPFSSSGVVGQHGALRVHRREQLQVEGRTVEVPWPLLACGRERLAVGARQNSE